MASSDFLLKERVKELNCLYALSKVAWEKPNDLQAILNKTLEILPAAMQHPSLAEVSISVGKQKITTPGYSKSKYFIESQLSIDRKSYGKVSVGYRTSSGNAKPVFL